MGKSGVSSPWVARELRASPAFMLEQTSRRDSSCRCWRTSTRATAKTFTPCFWAEVDRCPPGSAPSSTAWQSELGSPRNRLLRYSREPRTQEVNNRNPRNIGATRQRKNRLIAAEDVQDVTVVLRHQHATERACGAADTHDRANGYARKQV